MVEVLIVLAVTAFLAAVVAPGYFGIRGKQVLNSMTFRVLSDVRQTAQRSRAQENGLQWGIRFWNPTGADNDYYEIWSGASYAAGTVLAKISLSPQLDFTDPVNNTSRDVIFDKATGIPNISTNIVISSSVLSNQIGLVSVNTSGKIDYDLIKDLVGYWDLDENTGTTANDNSGNGNSGTFSAAAPTWVAGVSCKSGNCLSFNGASNYVTAGNGSSLNVGSSFSLSAWIKTSSTALAYIIAKRNTDLDASIAYNLNIAATSGFGQFYVSNGTTNVSVSGTSNLADGTFHHLVGVFESGVAARIYIDGSLQNSAATTITSVNVNAAPFTMAVKSDLASGFLSGSIDEVRVYSRALSASEVTTLYNFNLR